MSPYLVLLILMPTEKQKFDEGAVPTIVGGLQTVMAKDDQDAAAKAMRFLPDEYKDKQDRVEVRLLPFARRG